MQFLDDGILIFDNIAISVLQDNNKNFWFCGNDIAIALGYKNNYIAIKKHVESNDIKPAKEIKDNKDIDGQTAKLYVNFSGACSLIPRSKLAKANELKSWLMNIISPAIHHYPTYCLHKEYIKKIKYYENKIIYFKILTEELNEMIKKNIYPDGAIICALCTSYKFTHDENLIEIPKEKKKGYYRIYISCDPEYLEQIDKYKRKRIERFDTFKRTYYPEKLYISIKAALYDFKTTNDRFICKIHTIKKIFNEMQLSESTYSIEEEINKLVDEQKKLQINVDLMNITLNQYLNNI